MLIKKDIENPDDNIIQFTPKITTIRLPRDPSLEDLAFDWTLSENDKNLIQSRRGDDNRRRFAVQICVLRKYGRFLEDYSTVSTKILGYIGTQLGLESVLSLSEGPRIKTETEYQQEIRNYLGYSLFDTAARNLLETWIGNTLSASLYVEDLAQLAENFLKSRRIVLPPIKLMYRVVNSLYSKVEKKILKEITEQIPEAVRKHFDELLKVKEGENKSRLYSFSEYPQEPKAKIISAYIKKYEWLSAVGIDSIPFTGVNPRLIQELSKAVKTYDVWRLKRFEENKRYALIACFMSDTKKTMLDYLVEMNSKFLTDMERSARNSHEHEHRRFRKKFRKGVQVLENLGRTLLSFEGNGDMTIGEFLKSINPIDLKSAIDDSESFRDLEDMGLIKKLQGKYPNFRRYFSGFLSLNLVSQPGAEHITEAIKLVRQLDKGDLKEIPKEAPIGFVPNTWRKALYYEDGSLNRRTWELSLAFTLKNALNSGDIFLPESRRHRSFWDLISGDKNWEKETPEVYQNPKVSVDVDEALGILKEKYVKTANKAIRGFHQNPFIKHRKGEISFGKDLAVLEPPETSQIRQQIHSLLPKIRIEQLLREVNQWCGFSEKFQAAGNSNSSTSKDLPLLFAGLVAHGTNLGISSMADSTENITVNMLQNFSRNFIRKDTLTAANTVLVDYQQGLETSGIYGQGEVSSSDGKRYGVRESSLISSFYPRYFGYYERALTIYTHVSDQYSVFNTAVISCSEREAPYVLNGLLENDSSLPVFQHHVDTGGYMDLIFALCYLLGFSFMPRFKDLKKQRLFRLDRNSYLGELDPLFKETLNLEIIKEQWDQFARIAASLKNRIVPANVVIQRLSSSSPSDRLSKGLMELGRFLKTIYIMNYIQDFNLRKDVHRQLNRGEHRHNLADFIFFAHRGQFMSGKIDDIINKASSLSLISNAILVWNTTQIERIVRKLRADGHVIENSHLAHISPLMFEHIIVNGVYDFYRTA